MGCARPWDAPSRSRDSMASVCLESPWSLNDTARTAALTWSMFVDSVDEKLCPKDWKVAFSFHGGVVLMFLCSLSPNPMLDFKHIFFVPSVILH